MQDAALLTVLAGQWPGEVERPVHVRLERAVILTVGLRARPSCEGPDGFFRQLRLVEADTDEAMRHIRLGGVDAVEPDQLATHLVYAAPALGGPRQQKRELETAFGHDADRPSPAEAAPAGEPSPAALPDGLSGPCSTCSRVMSSSTRMCASSGE